MSEDEEEFYDPDDVEDTDDEVAGGFEEPEEGMDGVYAMIESGSVVIYTPVAPGYYSGFIMSPEMAQSLGAKLIELGLEADSQWTVAAIIEGGGQ